MCHGECESMRALYAVSPDFVPRPVGWGTHESDPNQHFFLCEFVDLEDEIPPIVEFCGKLADLHRRSQEISTNGKREGMFGFHVSTCNGTVAANNTWNESWEAFYIQNMKHLFMLEEQIHGPSDEIQMLLPTLYEKVIPRLLRPLETEGRTLRPSLLHGDLWNGNTAVHAKTDQPYIFDAAAFWGHNECDLAKWRGTRFRMRNSYVKEYFKHFPISPPEEDWDDRNLLYSLRADLHDSILFPSATRFRVLLIITLKQLVDKFLNGYEGTEKRKGSDLDVHPDGPPAIANELDATVDAEHEGLLVPAEQQVPKYTDMTETNDFAAAEHHEDRTYKDNIMVPSIGELLADNPSQTETENTSEIGLGESAISPKEGSVAGP